MGHKDLQPGGRLVVGGWALGDGGVDGDLAGTEVHVECNEHASGDHGPDPDQAGLRAEGAAGPEFGAALPGVQEGCAHGLEAAHGETVDVALEKVPGDVQPDGDGELAGEDTGVLRERELARKPPSTRTSPYVGEASVLGCAGKQVCTCRVPASTHTHYVSL